MATTYATRPSTHPSHRRRSERGQGLIEFALMAPFVLIFLFLIIDFGIGINRRVVITNAAREAARYATTGHTVAEIQQRAITQSEGLVTDPNKVKVTFLDTNGDNQLNPGDAVAVKICYSYTWLSPIRAFASALPTSLEMNARTDMRLEQVATSATIGTEPACP